MTNSFKRRDGTLRAQLFDETNEKIYDNNVGVNDRKGLEKLLEDLEIKGVNLPNMTKKKAPRESEWFT